tara:strand:+ start:15 stop:1652 length:1638 start_codon:yes stop_codon:yes gene_type:complete
MPIIYTYPRATPNVADLIQISSATSTPTNATRTCSIGDVVGLVTALVPGGGTVTSVGLSSGTTGLSVSMGVGEFNPITTAGTFTLDGTLVVDNGGTGAKTLTGVLKGNGTGAFTASNVVLTTGGTSEVTGILPIANGGIGHSTYIKGDIIYAPDTEGITALSRLGIGDEDDILIVGGAGIPSWTAISSRAVTSVDVSGGATGLTFSGGPITGTGTMTMAGTLAVASGGTGVGTFTSGGILYGNVTGAIQATAQPSNGQLLIGSTGTNPVLSALTAGANITINNSAGGIEIVGASSGGDGVYGGSGSLGGDTVITLGTNDLTFTATSGDVVFNNTGATPAFFIEGTSNKIGIGTGVPTSELDIAGSIFISNGETIGRDNGVTRNANIQFTDVSGLGNAAINFRDGGTDLVIIDGSGSVGIGTTTPTSELDVVGSIFVSNAQTIGRDNGTTRNANIQFADVGPLGNPVIVFRDGGSDLAVIDASGSVGIGTTSPSTNADLTLEGGSLAIKETTTPTADADYGKIYCKADNKLYFQDGAGVEHEIAFV